MRRGLFWLAGLAIAGAGAGWLLTAPKRLPTEISQAPPGDAARGQMIFDAAGCASCHIAPGTSAGAMPVLAGGAEFASAFGTFVAPNISSDPVAGIGAWTDAELMDAIMRGVGRRGEHLYPAFPWTSYAKAEPQDISDLIAHLRTLPASAEPSQPHRLGFPFNIRRAIGGWKLLFFDTGWVLAGDLSPELERGRYLVEALGHCAECHTPRGALGQPEHASWLGGGANPSGLGEIPNITSGGLWWSEDEVAEYLLSGFTPDFDTAGGEMAEVVQNTARLSDDDRYAIAAYLAAVPPVAPAE